MHRQIRPLTHLAGLLVLGIGAMPATAQPQPPTTPPPQGKHIDPRPAPPPKAKRADPRPAPSNASKGSPKRSPHPAQVEAPPADPKTESGGSPRSSPTSTRKLAPEKLASVLVFVDGGLIVGWDMAGQGAVGVLIGGQFARLHVAARLLFGTNLDQDSTVAAVGGEVGFRGLIRVHRSWRLTFLVASAYSNRHASVYRSDTVFRYHIAVGRVAVGAMYLRTRRLTFGFEVGGSAGYAFNYLIESGAKDYSGFYGGFECRTVITF